MPFRTPDTYTIPGKGTVNVREKTFTGKGKGPAGTRKVRAPRSAEVPSVTTASSGRVSSSGFRSQKTARRAERAAAASQRRVRGILRDVARGRQKRSERVRERLPEPSQRRGSRAVRTAPSAATKALPSFEPQRFAGKPTAGTPQLGELRKARRSGKLKVNRKGYVTTPRVRRATGTIKRIEQRATLGRSSAARLPGLDAEQAQVTRTVLRRGERVRATRKEKLAAVETGLVESNMRNLDYGDADSKGFRQERTSLYGDGPAGPTNVKAAADRLYREMRTDLGTATAPTPGLLAQAAQGSAYPERYDERAPQAKAILRAYDKGKLRPGERRKLKRVEAKARKLGLKAGERSGGGPVPKRVLTRFKAAKRAAGELEKAKLPYVWGGGHGDPTAQPTGGGLDCSGAVSYVLNKMGAMKGSLVSGEMGQVLEPGPGAVTVFYNAGHTFMKIGNRYFGTSRTNPSGGPGFVESPGDLSQYNVGHVPGLGKKVAMRMGISLTGNGSFPGMTLSGTTAAISGEASSIDEPGFSKRPIKATPRQKAQRKFGLLEKLGVAEGIVPGVEKPDKRPSATLGELERRYGV